jgi:hypothetical protein
MIQPGALQDAFNNNAYVISNIKNQSVEWGEQCIIIRNTRAPNEIVRLASGGIFLTEDGGEWWTTGITAKGINAKVITTGTLNAALANITTGASSGGVTIDGDGIIGKNQDRKQIFKLGNDGSFKIGNEGGHINFSKEGILDISVDRLTLPSGGTIGGQHLLYNTSFNLKANGQESVEYYLPKDWNIINSNNTKILTIPADKTTFSTNLLKICSKDGNTKGVTRGCYQNIKGIKNKKKYTLSGEVFSKAVNDKVQVNGEFLERQLLCRLYSTFNASSPSKNVIAI